MSKGISQTIVDKQKWLDDLADVIQPAVNDLFSKSGDAGKVAKDLLNGVWLGHPLHPVITDVPIGAWTVSQAFDLISIARGGDDALDSASDLALGLGIVAAFGAAASGIADWSDVGGSHRRMGLAHALVNTGGLALQIGSLALRGSGGNRGMARLLSASGYVLNAAAAYIAGELIYNLGMAVNRDAWVSGPEKFTEVAAVADLKDGEMVKVDVDGRPVVLVSHDDGVHAFEGTCPHYGCGLWEGKLEGHVLTCQCHGSQFDITDGSLLHGPATSSLPSYEVRKRKGQVEIKLREEQ